MKILIADDSAMLRDRISSAVSELKAATVVRQMQDWPATLQAICEFLPDVVIMDIQMIRGRGITALRNLKAHNPSLVLIVMSTLNESQYRRKIIDAGADFYLDKSAGIEQLREIVRSLHERFRSKADWIT